MVRAGHLPPDYFEAMYAAQPDPWDFGGRWYEQRKRAVTVASLPRRRFRRGFEPGCSIGLLSEQLADRCDELLCTDVSQVAVDAGTVRLSRWPNARAAHSDITTDWPDGEFDLVVISEIAYYCGEAVAAELGRRAADSLTDDGVILLCHWLHPVADYPLSGRAAQRAVREGSGLDILAQHEEDDFLLQVLVHPGHPSVATDEGLVR